MSDFDWVSARANCSAAAVFANLRQSIKADVEKRDSQIKEVVFLFHNEEHNFHVTRRLMNGMERSISFVRSPNSIGVIDDAGKQICIATLTITKERECRLLVNGDELTEWQFRKMVLEPLFFE